MYVENDDHEEIKIEPQHDKTNKMNCTLSED